MYTCEIKQALYTKSRKDLKEIYEIVCQEYVSRLCKLWEVSEDEAWWGLDEIGDELHIADAPWLLDMTEVRYIVENEVTYEQYEEYWEFVEQEISSGLPRPRINFRSWFKMGARPEILENQNDT